MTRLLNEDEHKKWAKIALAYLVKHIKYFQGGDKLLTYGELAKRINYPQPHIGNLFSKNIGNTLGVMGRLIENIQIDGWLEPIPLIQSIVVSSSTKLPSDGLKEFNKSYPNLTKEKKKDYVNNEVEKIFKFGTYWEEVIRKLNIKSEFLKVEKSHKQTYNPYGSEGSPEHQNLRNSVSTHPELFGFSTKLIGNVEYPLKSGDSIDVFFEDETRMLGIEVKSLRSGDDDLERGLYQTVKYSSVLKAEAIVQNIQKQIDCMLVIEKSLNKKHLRIKRKLEIDVFENFKPI